MSKTLRLSEKWFRRGLWLLSFVFAGFLVGLGGLAINDLPKVEEHLSREAFLDQAQNERIKIRTAEIDAELDRLTAKRDSLNLEAQAARAAYTQQYETFRNWLATRSSTHQQSQDVEVVQRTKNLDALKAKESDVQKKMEEIERSNLELTQEKARLHNDQARFNSAADQRLEGARRKQELRIFLYRLMLTLPLILISGWLFVKKRKTAYWPFVWGFIFFGLFAFFVELVPYLPSYGGYVRYVVGILVTVIVGHYGIRAMQNYLAKQKAQEAEPDSQRRQNLAYDMVLARLSKKVCPGCERPIEIEKPEVNHCPHCGISVFNKCERCQARKNSFSPFCYGCGAPALMS